jgi:class 3 adenylate cyclase
LITNSYRVNSSASEDRLESLIRQRLEPGADKKRIDERIWDLFGEDWSVMFTDLSGFSRRVAEFGIIHFLQTIYEAERLLLPIIEEHDGILLKTEGDSFLVIFRNPAKALHCSIAMQRCLADYDRGRPDEEKVLLCVGLGHGKVLRIGDADVYGAEVNAASKLGEDTAKAWEILVTGAMRDAIEAAAGSGGGAGGASGAAAAAGQEGIGFEELGEAPPGAASAFRVKYQL